MATVGFAIVAVDSPVPAAVPESAESINTAASSPTGSEQTSISVSATTARNLYWVVTADGGDVWVKFGSSPTAAAGDDWLVIDGTTRYFKASAGQKGAAIDAA